MSARQLASAYRRKKLSPVKVVDVVISRIEKLDPKLNAFCLLRPEEARKEAKRAENAFRAGKASGRSAGSPYP